MYTPKVTVYKESCSHTYFLGYESYRLILVPWYCKLLLVPTNGQFHIFSNSKDFTSQIHSPKYLYTFKGYSFSFDYVCDFWQTKMAISRSFFFELLACQRKMANSPFFQPRRMNLIIGIRTILSCGVLKAFTVSTISLISSYHWKEFFRSLKCHSIIIRLYCINVTLVLLKDNLIKKCNAGQLYLLISEYFWMLGCDWLMATSIFQNAF